VGRYPSAAMTGGSSNGAERGAARPLSRRQVLAGTGLVLVGGGAVPARRPPATAGDHRAPSPPSPTRHAARGVSRLASAGLDPLVAAGSLQAAARRVADRLDVPADAASMVGFGPRVVARFGDQLPGAAPLPEFRHDDAIPDARRGGDLAIAIESPAADSI